MNVLRILGVWFCVAVLGTVVIGGVWLFSIRAAYNARSERAICILHIRNVQQAVRSHAESKDLDEGDPLDISFLKEYMKKMPECPEGGTFVYLDKVPAKGVLYCTCSKGCGPDEHPNW